MFFCPDYQFPDFPFLNKFWFNFNNLQSKGLSPYRLFNIPLFFNSNFGGQIKDLLRHSSQRMHSNLPYI
jgi:hypothetical protein